MDVSDVATFKIFKNKILSKNWNEAKKWAIVGIFFVYFWPFQRNNTTFAQQINVEKSIQYSVLGFELTTSCTSLFSHNHKTRSGSYL